MAATKKNLIGDDRIEAGSDFIRVWVFNDSSGSAHSLTSQAFTASFRPTYDSEASFVASVALTTAGAGKITITITDTATRDYARSAAAAERNGMRGVWDLESVHSGTGRVIRWLEGNWTMTDEATR